MNNGASSTLERRVAEYMAEGLPDDVFEHLVQTVSPLPSPIPGRSLDSDSREAFLIWLLQAFVGHGDLGYGERVIEFLRVFSGNPRDYTFEQLLSMHYHIVAAVSDPLDVDAFIAFWSERSQRLAGGSSHG